MAESEKDALCNLLRQSIRPYFASGAIINSATFDDFIIITIGQNRAFRHSLHKFRTFKMDALLSRAEVKES